MAKAANAAYPNIDKPLGYRSFSRAEWDAVAEGCDEMVYTEDGYFNVGSGLRGRLMVNMLIVLARVNWGNAQASPRTSAAA